MKKILATLLILCSVVAATSFGSEAKLEPSYQWLSKTISRAELQASYPAKCNQMILTLNMRCRNGMKDEWAAQNVTDNTYSVSTLYLANSKTGPIITEGKHFASLKIIVNGQTLIM